MRWGEINRAVFVNFIVVTATTDSNCRIPANADVKTTFIEIRVSCVDK